MNHSRITVSRGASLSIAMLCLVSSTTASAHSDRTLSKSAEKERSNWAQIGGESTEWHFSPLAYINDSNVNRLGLAWSFQFDTNRGQEASPVVINGVMYVTSAWSKVFAINAATGALLWSYDPGVPRASGFNACCDAVNRGVALAKGRVFLGTIDGRLIALDARDGRVIWTRFTTDRTQPYAITGVPRVVKNTVIIGNAGSEYGVRGYVTAYDISTGDQRWRFYTVPGRPGASADGAASDTVLQKVARPTWFGHWYEYGGGGTVWDTIVFDAEFNQVLIGTGNGTPWDRRVRSDGKGDNLFLASIVALDADTGRYRWHYQETPGDSWDFDATQGIILSHLPGQRGSRSVLMQASKNGFFYVIDRRSGKLLSAQNYVPQNWTDGIDLATGRPQIREGARYEQPSLIMPCGAGGHSWQPMAFNPATRLVYIPAMEVPGHYGRDDHFTFRRGAWNTALDLKGFIPPEDPAALKALRAMVKGELIAWDPIAGTERWRVMHDGYWNGGVLSTGGNLVFQGEGSGAFQAFRADDGTRLWSFSAPSGVMAAPVSYRVGVTQYVAVLSGWGGVRLNAPQGTTQRQAPPGRVLVFALDGNSVLPSSPTIPLPAANPAADPFTREQVAQGADAYNRNCAVCHGQAAHGGDVLPDLRRTRALNDRAAWQTIVIDGALESGGMIGFKRFISASEAEAIRAYISGQAETLRDRTEKQPPN